MTRGERDRVVAGAYQAAEEPGLNPRAQRKRAAVADLVAFLAGTGVRIDEGRRLRWDQVDLERGRAYIRGTKSESSDRWLSLPEWLVAHLSARANRHGTRGYVFPSPAHLNKPDRLWDQSNSAKAVRAALDSAGLSGAVRTRSVGRWRPC